MCECGAPAARDRKGRLSKRGLCNRCYYVQFARMGANPIDSAAYRAIRHDLYVDRYGEPKWTPDAIVLAIQRWARDHDGRPPTARDWDRPRRRHDVNKPGRLNAPRSGHPSKWTVVKKFGSWNAAIEAAGFEPRTRPDARPARTHCRFGHPFTPENTSLRANGSFRCRQCERVRDLVRRRSGLHR
jgi:hypothetical protein